MSAGRAQRSHAAKSLCLACGSMRPSGPRAPLFVAKLAAAPWLADAPSVVLFHVPCSLVR